MSHKLGKLRRSVIDIFARLVIIMKTELRWNFVQSKERIYNGNSRIE